MKMNNLNEKFFRHLITNDPLKMEADKSIEQRINYAFMLQSPARKIHANSFDSFFSFLISFKQLGLKTAFATVLLFCFLYAGNFQSHNSSIQLADSCKVKSLVVDSNYMAKDTCK